MYKSKWYGPYADPVPAIERDLRRRADRVLSLALVATAFMLLTSFWLFTVAGSTFGAALLNVLGLS